MAPSKLVLLARQHLFSAESPLAHHPLACRQFSTVHLELTLRTHGSLATLPTWLFLTAGLFIFLDAFLYRSPFPYLNASPYRSPFPHPRLSCLARHKPFPCSIQSLATTSSWQSAIARGRLNLVFAVPAGRRDNLVLHGDPVTVRHQVIGDVGRPDVDSLDLGPHDPEIGEESLDGDPA